MKNNKGTWRSTGRVGLTGIIKLYEWVYLYFKSIDRGSRREFARMKPEDTFTSDDEAPEAVSISTTKKSMVEQMKREKQAKLSVKEKRKASDQVKRDQADAKKKQIEAAMADFVTKASADKINRDAARQETKVIKFESEDEEEEQEYGTILPDGSKIVLLNEPTSLLTRRVSENRAAMLKTRQKLAANPHIKRMPVSNKVNKKRKQQVSGIAMIGREGVNNKAYKMSTFSL